MDKSSLTIKLVEFAPDDPTREALWFLDWHVAIKANRDEKLQSYVETARALYVLAVRAELMGEPEPVANTGNWHIITSLARERIDSHRRRALDLYYGG